MRVEHRIFVTTLQVTAILALADCGCNDCEISRQLNIPRSTVRWHRINQRGVLAQVKSKREVKREGT